MKNEIKHMYHPNFVRDLFNSMSHSYERMNFIFSFGFTQIWRKAMLKKISKTVSHDHLKVIDLMTGMGETWKLIKDFYPNSQLIGLDISSGMLKMAQKKSDQKYGGHIKLMEQDVLDNDITDNSFDVVMCAFGLKTFNSDQIQQFSKEVFRILKPGGKFAFVEISSPKNIFLKLFYRIYLGKVTPIITMLLMGNPKEYRMLWKYAKNFSNATFTAQKFMESGLEANFDSYFFGCATGIHGRKPTSSKK